MPIKVVFEDSCVLYEVHQCIAADLKEYSNSNGSQVYYLVPECHFEKELWSLIAKTQFDVDVSEILIQYNVIWYFTI